MTPFADRLAEAIRRKGNPLCVGLDPRWESLPKSIRDAHGSDSLESVARAYEQFSLRVLDLVADRVAVVKPQCAFYEACGPAGLSAIQRVIHSAKARGLTVILDSKRGDIASTASAYAEAAFGGARVGNQRLRVWDADALTVNPYLGRDAVEPFLQEARSAARGVFVLVRTSNPGAGLFQELDSGGRKLYQHVAAAVVEWNQPASCGFGDVGAVVGATHPTELAELRAAMPAVWFLVPGYGAQGGAARDVAAAFRSDGLGAIVNSSRGITFPFQPDDPAWEVAICSAAVRAASELAESAGL